ncbi:MAG: hypothetical protein PHE21_02005 [Candidatus Dojkabacteria bacterium]|nr:hypothetical protein [Candidatus Dojkabacteria bacterium]
MKNNVRLFFVYILIIFFVFGIFEQGIVLPSFGIYLVATVILLSLTLMVSTPLLNFLTVKAKFLTYFLMSSILMIGVLFLLKSLMTDFYINEYLFEGINIGTLEIKSFTVSPVVTICSYSIVTSLIASIYRELDKTD